jgi:hypothetical protein
MTLLLWFWHAPSLAHLYTQEFEKGRVWNKVGGLWTHLHFFRSFFVSSAFLLCRVALFFKTEMSNTHSNSTWSKMKCISIKRCQNRDVLMWFTSLSTTQSLKTATDFSGPKSVIHPPKPALLKSSGKEKPTFLHVKFKARFDISFTRKFVSNKKWHFSKGWSILISKAAFEKIASFWFSDHKALVWTEFNDKVGK